MIQNDGGNNGHNTDTKWFCETEYLWRCGASVSWLILCLPCCLLALTSVSSIDVLHPISWISDIISAIFTIYFWLVFIFYGVVTVIFAVSTNKFNTVQEVIHKNRISFLIFILHPSHLLHMVLCCICGGVSSWFALNLLNKPFDSLTILSEESEEECFLNEHGLFVVVFGSWLGFYTSFQYFAKNEFHFKFPVIQQRKFFRVKAVVWQCVYQALKTTLKAIRFYYPLYYMFGNIPRKMFSTFLAASFQRTTGSLDSLTGLADIHLLWVLICTGSLWSFIWVFNNALFVIYNTQVYHFPIESSMVQDKNQCLSEVIKSKNTPLLKYLAFLDFFELSQFSIQRRKQVFSLSQPGGRPANWTSICNETLSALNNLESDLNAYIDNQIYLRQNNIGLWTNGTPSNRKIDSLMSPQSVSVSSPLSSSFNQSRLLTSQTVRSRGITERASFPSPHEKPSLGNSQCQYYMPTQSPKAAKVNSFQWRMKQIHHNFALFMRQRPVVAYLFNEQPSYLIDKLLADYQLYLWAVQGISSLVVASFSEDTFGVVQMTLPKVLSSLLALLKALDRLAKLPSTGKTAIQPRIPRPGDKESLPFRLRSVIVSSIYHITRTFGQHLDGMPLTSEHYSRLKGFLESKEV